MKGKRPFASKDTMKKTPFIPKTLVEWLEGIYQDKAPALTTSDREVWHKSGQVSVVRMLRRALDDQTRQELAQ